MAAHHVRRTGNKRHAITIADLAADRARALALTPVSRETGERLDRFVELLWNWQRTTNPDRTFDRTAPVDAAYRRLPAAARSRAPTPGVGSTSGRRRLPGLVIACALADTPGALRASCRKQRQKSRFLREAKRVTGAPADVHGERIEDLWNQLPGALRSSPRARSPLSTTCATLSIPLLGKSGAWLCS